MIQLQHHWTGSYKIFSEDKAILLSKQKHSRDLLMILHFVKHTVRYLTSVHLITVSIKLCSKAVHFLTLQQ